MAEVDGALTAAEQNYFATGGKADPAAPAADAAPVAEEAADTAAADPAAESTVEAPAEPAETAKPDPGTESKAEKLVPLPALQEARRETKEWREKYTRDFAKMEERLNELQRKVAPVKEEAAEPTWDAAPIEAGKLTTQKVEQIHQQLQQQAQLQQFTNAYRAQAAVFAEKQADFGSAYHYWQSHVDNELQDAGYTDPAMRAQEVQRFEMAIAQKAFADGANPAERIYNIAKRRGYTLKEEAPPATPATDATRQLRTVAKGVTAAKSLATSGAPSDPHLSLERLLDMDDDDFSKISEKEFRRLAGG